MFGLGRSRPTFATSVTCSIVATVSRPELVLVYNSSTGLHSLCLTKNATLEVSTAFLIIIVYRQFIIVI